MPLQCHELGGGWGVPVPQWWPARQAGYQRWVATIRGLHGRVGRVRGPTCNLPGRRGEFLGEAEAHDEAPIFTLRFELVGLPMLWLSAATPHTSMGRTPLIDACRWQFAPRGGNGSWKGGSVCPLSWRRLPLPKWTSVHPSACTMTSPITTDILSSPEVLHGSTGRVDGREAAPRGDTQRRYAPGAEAKRPGPNGPKARWASVYRLKGKNWHGLGQGVVVMGPAELCLQCDASRAMRMGWTHSGLP